MKKLVLLLMALVLLAGLASAYQVNLSAPDALAVGKPLVVTGTTNFGVGTPLDVVLYYQLTTTTEVKRKIVYIQSDQSFRAVFDTTGLKTGNYKVEVPANGIGDSVTMRLVTLYDRAEDISLSSPLRQGFPGSLVVAGTVRGDEDAGVQIEVLDPDGLVIFGPQYVNTNSAGSFSAQVPVSRPGDYEVSFTDARGYIGSRTITAVGPETLATPLPPPVQEAPPLTATVSAHSQASRDAPAYFLVEPGNGTVTLYTSRSIDWVMEYIDDRGILHMQNAEGDQNPEAASFTGRGRTVYVKIYPYKYSLTGEVFLYGENVRSITVSSAVPAPFASAAAPVTTEASPLPLPSCLLGLFTAIVLTGIRRR